MLSASPTPSPQFYEPYFDIVPSYSLSLGVSFTATSHFFNRYVIDTAFSYLPEYWSQVADEKIVQAALLPAAIAALSQSLRQPSLLSQARVYYSTALTAINHALSNPLSATNDGTLLAVLLLAMYEAVTFRGHISPQNWIMHVNGLATILDLREHRNRDSQLGQVLTRHASNQILTNCAQQSIPIPRHVRGCQQHKLDTFGPHSEQTDMKCILVGIAVLSASRKTTSAPDYFTECLRLDRLIAATLQRSHLSEPYFILSATECADGSKYTNQIHRYSSLSAVRHWNNFRTLRLVLNDWMCRTVDDPSFSDPFIDFLLGLDATDNLRDRVHSMAILNFDTMLGDLLASVPYSRDNLGTSNSASARFLVWPLSVAASSGLCSKEMKEFLIRLLRDIGVQDGIEQAQDAARMLHEGFPVEDW